MKIVIDTDEILLDANSAGEFVLKAEAEEHLVRLIEVKEKVDKVLDAVKKKLEKQGTDVNPHFSGVRGDRVKVGYSAHGAMYSVGDIDKIPQEFYTVKKSYSLRSADIKRFVTENKKLPDGVIENDRKKSVSISLVEKKV